MTTTEPHRPQRFSLKGGAWTSDVRLDRVDEKDPRSRTYPISELLTERMVRRPRSYTWRNSLQLDQGHEGACVGFAWAHELAARPAEVAGVTGTMARESIYFPAQRLDRFPGGAYPGAVPFLEGTSVVAGAKAVKELGYMDEYRWAFDFDDLVASVGYRGPAVFGCAWYQGMAKPGPDGLVRVEGRRIGGHCIMINGVRVRWSGETIDPDASSFTFQNSWGARWGANGFGRISFADVKSLWDGAETCIPVVRRRRRSTAAS